MSDTATKYSFAIGKQIKQIFTESYLYLDGSNNIHELENSSIRRIDKPLFLLLENGEILMLYGTSFSKTDEFLREYVFGEDFHHDIKTQQEFQFMCGKKISNVEEYKVFFDYEDKENNLNEFADPIKPSDVSSIAITLDNGVRLVCEMFFDYCDVCIVW